MLHDLIDEVLALRAWPDKSHIPLEDIPQLGELIEVMGSDECPDLCQTAIAILVELGLVILLSIHPHGAELIQRKGFPLVADTLLTEDDISLWLFTVE